MTRKNRFPGAARAAAWVLALFAFSTDLALGQQGKVQKSAPRLSIAPEDHDFGSVGQDEKLVHEFAIVNEGTEALEIRRISTSCGCAAALAAERVVPPGGTTTLRVTLETRKSRGRIERSVSLASNDPRRVHTVRVQAFVEAP
jgi:hypothetical protein